MSFQFYCNNCYADLSADESMDGQELECPSCNNLVTVNSKPSKPKKTSKSPGILAFLFMVLGATIHMLYFSDKLDDEFGKSPLIGIFLAGVTGAISGVIGVLVEFVIDVFKKD